MRKIFLILSTADYDAELWTNKQHIARRLADEFDVVYVNSIGLRSPKFSKSDISRVTKRIFRRPTGPAKTARPANLRVVNPMVFPWHSSFLFKNINKLLLQIQVKKIVNSITSQAILWTFTPVTYGIEKYFDQTFYHLVDLLHTVEGVSPNLILENEARLLGNVDAAVASSKGVMNHLGKYQIKTTLLWENVADVSLFQSNSMETREDRVVYFGNLSTSKIDFEILNSIGRSGFKLLLVGPVGIDGTEIPDMRRLLDRSNVTVLGPVTQDQMAKMCATSKIGIIPYLLNSHTAGIFPMKTFEYLAAGLEVVSTNLSSLEELTIERLSFAEAKNFSEIVERKMKHYTPPSHSFIQNLSSNSWEYRVKQIVDLVDGTNNVGGV